MANLFAKAAVGSDIGISRSNNEDNYYLNGKYPTFEDDTDSASDFHSAVTEGVFAVFDGMGGQSKGEFASFTAAQTLDKYKDKIVRGNTNKVYEYISDTNKQICDEMKKHNERIGCTMAMLTISDGVAQAYNLGDSSIYHISNKKITKLTRDHTVAEQMYRMNALTEEEARRDVRRHSLTKHLGMFADENDLKPYVSNNIRVSNGDMFLLCTDGITNSVTEKEIKKILDMFDGRCKKSVNALIELAIENGSDDNLTAMVIRIVNSTNSSTLNRQLKRHPRFFPFLLGVGISAIFFIIIITIILSHFS